MHIVWGNVLEIVVVVDEVCLPVRRRPCESYYLNIGVAKYFLLGGPTPKSTGILVVLGKCHDKAQY